MPRIDLRIAPRSARTLAAVLVMLAPAASVAEPATEPIAAPDTDAASENDCPDALRGTTVSAKEIKHGVALEFETASRPMVAGLRRHVRELKTFFDQHADLQSPAASKRWRMKVGIKNTAAGARVLLEADRPADVFDLRVLGQRFEDAWEASSCGPAASMPSSGRTDA